MGRVMIMGFLSMRLLWLLFWKWKGANNLGRLFYKGNG